MRVSGDPRLLDDQLLEELARRWREQGAFVATALRAGLSDEQMDEATAPLGLRLPREARLWWGWHDGASPQIPGIAAELGPGRAFLSLAEAARECQRLREVMRYAWGDELGSYWRESWLPIDAYKRPILFDCGVGFDDPVPVRSFFMEDPGAGAEGVRSIGELVLVWIQAIDCGAWTYDGGEDHWDYDWEKLPPSLQQLHLT
jgi:cell wall assembly regulator SMI1